MKMGIVKDWAWTPIRSDFWPPSPWGHCWNWLCFYVLVKRDVEMNAPVAKSEQDKIRDNLRRSYLGE